MQDVDLNWIAIVGRHDRPDGARRALVLERPLRGWLGFMAAVLAANTYFGGQPRALWFITAATS